MDNSYIAGFVDGEGTIHVHGNRVRVSISNTHLGVLEQIQKEMGGNVHENKKRQSHWKDSWTYWTTSTPQALAFLKKVAPYLIIKKDKANEGIAVAQAYTDKKEQWEQKMNMALQLVLEGKSYREAETLTGVNRSSIHRRVKRSIGPVA